MHPRPLIYEQPVLTIAGWNSQRVARVAEGRHHLLLREYLLSDTEEISSSLSEKSPPHLASTSSCLHLRPIVSAPWGVPVEGALSLE